MNEARLRLQDMGWQTTMSDRFEGKMLLSRLSAERDGRELVGDAAVDTEMLRLGRGDFGIDAMWDSMLRKVLTDGQ